MNKILTYVLHHFIPSSNFTFRYKTAISLEKLATSCRISHIAVILFIGTSASVTAQYAPPIKDSLFSAILNEQRRIEITLPEGFNAEKDKAFDVWYVLDGESNTHTFTTISSYLIGAGFVPSSIIVSVPNTYVNGYNSRQRDLTPSVTDLANSGGAENFLSFLQEELLPYIKNKYGAIGSNGLFGSSFGGLFTLFTLMEQPALFRYHLLSDPAFQYGDNYLVKKVKQQLRLQVLKNTVLFIGGRSGETYPIMARDAMDTLLTTEAPAGLFWKSTLYDDETHTSVTLKTLYDGLKFTYKGYSNRNNTFFYTGGIVVDGLPVRQFLETDLGDVRYTTDGTVPDVFSKRVNNLLLVTDPEKTIVKSISPSGRFDRIISANLRKGNYLSPKPLSKKTRSAGKLDSASTLINGIMNGYVNIPEDSYYVMYLTPSEGTKFYFNDSLLIANDPLKKGARQAIIVPLRKGNYALRLEHAENPNLPKIDFEFCRSKNGQDDWWQNSVLRIK